MFGLCIFVIIALPNEMLCTHDFNNHPHINAGAVPPQQQVEGVQFVLLHRGRLPHGEAGRRHHILQETTSGESGIRH